MSEGLPEGWELKKLGEISNIIMGQSPSSETYNVIRSGLPFYQGKADFGGYYTKTRYWCSEPTKIAPENSILFSVRASVGDINFTKVKCCIGRGLSAINGNTINQSFLYQSLKFVKPKFQLIAQGSTFEAVNGSDLKEFILLTPPLPEQKKIAKILSSVDKVTETTENQINKLKDLKKGLMNELLTKGIGHTEFKDSPVGRIPVGWEVVKFDDVSIKIQDGTHFSPKSKTGDYLYITSKNIKKGFLDLSSVQYISTKEHEEIYRRCNVKYGDILLTKDGAMTGNCAINSIKKPFSLLSSVAFIRCNDSLCYSKFIFQFILSDICQNEIKDLMTGNAITRLTLQKIKALKLISPPLQEQQKIASILTSIDTNIEQKQTKLTQSKNLKKSLMADLLTGRVRVKLNEH